MVRALSLAAILSLALASVAWAEPDDPAEEGPVTNGRPMADRPIEAMTLEQYGELAADGDPEIQYRLAQIYEEGRDGARLDYVTAAKWYRLSAEQGHTAAQWSLSLLLEYGKGVQKDIFEAYKWASVSLMDELQGSELSLERSPRIYRLRWQLPAEQLAEAEILIRDWKHEAD